MWEFGSFHFLFNVELGAATTTTFKSLQPTTTALIWMLLQTNHKCRYVRTPLTPKFTLDHQNVVHECAKVLAIFKYSCPAVLRNAQPRNGQEAAPSGGGLTTVYTKRDLLQCSHMCKKSVQSGLSLFPRLKRCRCENTLTPPPLLCLWWRTTRAGLFQPQQSTQQTDATGTHQPSSPPLGSRDSAGSLIATCGWPGFRLPWRQASLSSQTTQYLTGPINMGGLWWMECCQAWTESLKLFIPHGSKTTLSSMFTTSD